jgi:hypothetical protein
MPSASTPATSQSAVQATGADLIQFHIASVIDQSP